METEDSMPRYKCNIYSQVFFDVSKFWLFKNLDVVAASLNINDVCDYFITFCGGRRQRKMSCGHARLCVCVCVCVCLSVCPRPHAHIITRTRM